MQKPGAQVSRESPPILMAAHHSAGWPARQEEDVAQGSLSSLAAFPPRREVGGAAGMFTETVLDARPNLKQIVLLAAQQEPAPLDKPQGRRAGPRGREIRNCIAD